MKPTELGASRKREGEKVGGRGAQAIYKKGVESHQEGGTTRVGIVIEEDNQSTLRIVELRGEGAEGTAI